MRWAIRILGAVFLLTIVAVTLARRENSGWIAFSSFQDSELGLYLMTGDGTSFRRITQGQVCPGPPLWSPDGTWIATTSSCPRLIDLFLYRPGGSLWQMVPAVSSFDWSPDGNHLVVAENPSGLRVFDLDNGNAHLVGDDFLLPQWSPDGVWIYARTGDLGERTLHRIHMSTGQTERLLMAYNFSFVTWSPDGEQIALSLETENRAELYVMSPDASVRTLIPLGIQFDALSDVHWSPGGEWIAFTARKDYDQNVYWVRPDGRDFGLLSEVVRDAYQVSWSPDGKWVLFVGVSDGPQSIFRLRSDGSILDNLTQKQLYGGVGSPQYAPVSGLDWRPLWLIIASFSAILLSMMRRSRP